MKVLGGVGWLANLEVVAGCELEKAFDPSAGVFWPLPLVAMGQKQHYPREQIPLVLAGTHKLVDDGLCHVGEVAELCLPENEGFGIVAAVTVFEAKHACFRQSGIVNIAVGLVGSNVLQGNVFIFVFDIKQDGMALVEGATTAVLPTKPNWNPVLDERAEGECFRHTEIDRPFT